MNRLTFISLLSVVILVLASLVHWQGKEVIDPIAQQQQRANEPDFYMQDATVMQYSESGRLKQQMDAQLIQHYPEGDFTLADSPQITLFRNDTSPWRISAAKGRGTNNNDVIDLWSNVNVQRTLPGTTQNLNTEKLTIINSENLALTDQKVTITDASTRLDAIGMKAYIDENRIEFLSNVRVNHDPSKVN